MPPEIPNPHDRFVRESFGRTDLAADFMAHYLAPELLAGLDLATLRLERASFVDDDLRLLQSDLLYEVKRRDDGEAWIYLLLEHKSYQDRLVSLQLLGYLVRIWERDSRAPGAGPRPLRPILPVVLYHGPRPWNGPREIGELVDRPEGFEGTWPELRFTLVDLSEQSGIKIVGGIALQVVLMILQVSRSPDMRTRLPRILTLLGELNDQQSALGWLQAVLRYISMTSEVVTEKELMQTAREALSAPGGEGMATLVEQWLDRGRQEGLMESIELLLEERFGSAGRTLLSEIRAIEDRETLRAILRRLGQVESIERLREVYR